MKKYDVKRSDQTGKFEVFELLPFTIGEFKNRDHADIFAAAMRNMGRPAVSELPLTRTEFDKAVADAMPKATPSLITATAEELYNIRYEVFREDLQGALTQKDQQIPLVLTNECQWLLDHAPDGALKQHVTALQNAMLAHDAKVRAVSADGDQAVEFTHRFSEQCEKQSEFLSANDHAPYPQEFYNGMQAVLDYAVNHHQRAIANQRIKNMELRDKLLPAADVPAPAEPKKKAAPTKRETRRVDEDNDAAAKAYIKKMTPLASLYTKELCQEELNKIADLADAGGLSKEWFDKLVNRKNAITKRLEGMGNENPPAVPHKDQAAADFLKTAKLLSTFKTEKACEDEIQKINKLDAECDNKKLADQLDARRSALIERQKGLVVGKNDGDIAKESVRNAKKAEDRTKTRLVDEGFVDRVADELIENVHAMSGTSLSVVYETLRLRNGWEKAEVEAALMELVKQKAVMVCPAPHERTTRVFLLGLDMREPLTGDEELVYEKLVESYPADERKFLEIKDVPEFQKLFKGSLRRDCMRHLKKLEEKSHLGIITNGNDRMVIRLVA